jgi:hypothetical protein
MVIAAVGATFVASTTIIIPAPERAAYGSTRADSRARNDLRTTPVTPLRAPDARDGNSGSTRSGYDASRPSQTLFGEPRGTLPFLAQQLAQDDSTPEASADGEVVPAVRFSALRAYSTARESTIEYLSPTPLYDFRV